jgi:hypothetical protein
MKLPSIITNSLPITRRQILNSIDRGIGALGISLTSSTGNNNLKDLTDITIVNKTIPNARRAFEIDPTVRSSVLSMIIIANGDWEISTKKGMKLTDEDSLTHIERKAKEWDLNQIINGQAMKNVVDGRCFIRKKGFANDITNVDFLAFDEENYNFIELRDSRKLWGYMQKAMEYTVPATWKTDTFDTLANRKGEVKEIPFNPGDVIAPRLLEDGSGFVYGALDDVYCKKLIKNYGPTIVKRALMTLGVEVGTKEIPNPFKDAFSVDDSYESKMAKTEAILTKLGNTFAKKEEKDTIVHTYGSKPYMIGEGKLVDITTYTDMYKQEIKEALLTPDSLFDASQSSYAASKEQMGSKGRLSVIDFIQDNVNQYQTTYLFDDQLNRANYTDDVGKIYIKFTPLEIEDDKTLAEVGEKLESLYPSLDEDDKLLRQQTYFPAYHTARQAFLADQESDEPKGNVIVNSITNTDNGFIEGQDGTMQLLNSWRKFVIDEEIVKPPYGKKETV